MPTFFISANGDDKNYKRMRFYEEETLKERFHKNLKKNCNKFCNN